MKENNKIGKLNLAVEKGSVSNYLNYLAKELGATSFSVNIAEVIRSGKENFVVSIKVIGHIEGIFFRELIKESCFFYKSGEIGNKFSCELYVPDVLNTMSNEVTDKIYYDEVNRIKELNKKNQDEYYARVSEFENSAKYKDIVELNWGDIVELKSEFKYLENDLKSYLKNLVCLENLDTCYYDDSPDIYSPSDCIRKKEIGEFPKIIYIDRSFTKATFKFI